MLFVANQIYRAVSVPEGNEDIVPGNTSSLPRKPSSSVSPFPVIQQFASLPRFTKNLFPTHYPRQSSLSTLPSIVKPKSGSSSGGFGASGSLPRKSKRRSPTSYEPVFEDSRTEDDSDANVATHHRHNGNSSENC